MFYKSNKNYLLLIIFFQLHVCFTNILTLIKKSAMNKEKKPRIGKEIIGEDVVMWGKSAESNDILTFELSQKGDWWFHAHGTPGSHVILRTDIKNKDEVQSLESFKYAVEKAATLCKSKPKYVTWCEITKVTKNWSDAPGKVIVNKGYRMKVYL